MSQSRCLSDAGCTMWSDQLRDMISIRKSGVMRTRRLKTILPFSSFNNCWEGCSGRDFK